MAMDAGWTNRGTGKTYNSDSCQHITVGNMTQRVIGLHYLSRCCAKCDANQINVDNSVTGGVVVPCGLLCSHNYCGSSKGMESQGALEMTRRIWNKLSAKSYLCEIVIDDDTTTKKLLTKSISELLLAGIIDEWPKTTHTKVPRKIRDTGKLPIDHPDITWLSDINHRMRCKSRREFSLARAPMRTSKMTLMDAYCMKRNMSYCVYEHAQLPFEAFRQQCKAVLEHHFGNHSMCGKWCPFLQCGGDKRKESALFYRDKQRDHDLYLQMKYIHEQFTTDEALKQIHHGYNANRCESLNRFISKFVCKDGYRCRTICSKA